MSVRAKFKLNSITRMERTKYVKDENGKQLTDGKGFALTEPSEMHTLEFAPVYGNNGPNHENTKFWEASPSGNLKLDCINLEASNQFKLGAEYYLDFTEAPKD